MSAFVIKAWKSGSKPVNDQGHYVHIEGRRSGLVAWLLARLRLDPTTRIAVSLERLEFTSTSLAGTEARLIPLQGISSTYYGYHKPWKAAVSLAGLFAFLGLSLAREGGAGAGLAVLAVGTLIALAYYLLNRTLTLGFVEVSGAVSGIQFKRSVIEGVDINESQARDICTLVQRLIESKQRRMSQPRPAPKAA